MKVDRKNVVWNIIGNTSNALISLVLMIIVTRINGENIAGLYAFAFSVALVFYCIGVYYGRIYQVSDTSGCSDGDFIVSKIVTCLCMMVVTVGFVLLKQYDLLKCECIFVFCLFKAMEAFSECIYSILQKNNELYKVGISYTIKSIIVAGAFLVIDLITHDLLLASGGIIVGHLVVFAFYDINNLKRINMDLTSKHSRRVFLYKDGFCPFAISFLFLYIINASKYAIDLKLTNYDQTIYSIIIMPSTVVLLFVQYVVQPYVKKISQLYEEDAYSNIRDIVRKLMLAIGMVSVVGVAVAATIGIPVLEFIYGIGLHEYKPHLIIIMLGAGLFGISNILSNVLVAMRKSVFQAVTLLILAVIASGLSVVLTIKYNLLGATISYALVMFAGCIVFTLFMFINLYSAD